MKPMTSPISSISIKTIPSTRRASGRAWTFAPSSSVSTTVDARFPLHTILVMQNRALIIGASGIAGSSLASRLLSSGWQVHGLSRGRTAVLPQVQAHTADLTSAESVRAALDGLDVTHVFFTAWSRQATERENIRVNGAMVSNVLD